VPNSLHVYVAATRQQYYTRLCYCRQLSCIYLNGLDIQHHILVIETKVHKLDFLSLLMFIIFSYKLPFKMWAIWLDFFVYIFKRSLISSPRLHLFDKKYSKNSNMKFYNNLKYLVYIWIYFKIRFIHVDLTKLNFPQLPLIKSI